MREIFRSNFERVERRGSANHECLFEPAEPVTSNFDESRLLIVMRVIYYDYDYDSIDYAATIKTALPVSSFCFSILAADAIP
jgi:hypothetical protein